MQFKDIPEQTLLCNHLTESVDAGRLPHALMFCGDTPSGSLAVTLAYVQYLYCTNRQHYDGAPGSLRADSCGECPACRKVSGMVHSDVHMVFPTVGKTDNVSNIKSSADLQGEFRDFVLQNHGRAGIETWHDTLGIANQQSIIRERDADDIVKLLALKSYEGSFRTIVIWMAEKMNAVSANKLLKTLEEPAANTMMLLVAEETAAMLPTILSRVQQITVPSIVARDEWPPEFGPLFVGWMRLLFKLKMGELSKQVDELASMGREMQKRFLTYTGEMMRYSLLNHLAKVPNQLHTGDAKFDASFPAMITTRNAEAICAAVNEALHAIERNINPKITFMQLSFTLSKHIKNR